MKLLYAFLFAMALILVPAAVYAQEDVTGPILHRVWAVPDHINTTDQDQEITFFFEVTDDLSGFDGSVAAYISIWPSQVPSFHASPTDQPNVYSWTQTIPQYSKLGQHYLWQVTVFDRVGNQSFSRVEEEWNGEVREGICNSRRLDYSACAEWLEKPLFTNDPDYSKPVLYLPALSR